MIDDGFGKIFKQIYAGTLRANWKALITFEQMIVLCNSDGIIDMPPEVLHNITGIPLDIILDGIKALESPDPRSRSPEMDGRRIMLLDDHRDWGWQIVNHQFYRDLASREQTRSKTRERVRSFRERQNKNKDLEECNAPVTHGNASNDTHTHTHTQIHNKTIMAADAAYTDEFERIWSLYPKRSGDNPKKAAYQHFNARLKTNSIQDIEAGVIRYARFCDATGKSGTEYVMQAKRFFGTSKPFLNDWKVNHAVPATKPGKMARAAEALRKHNEHNGTFADSATANDRGTGVIPHAGPPARLRTDRR